MLKIIRAYFDDAGTHAGAPAVVTGGLVGTTAAWEALTKAWGEHLANPLPEAGKPPLKMFHMAACEAADGEFANYRPAERMLVAQHFRDIINKSGLASTATAIDVAAWDELVTGPVRGVLGSALECSFVNCLDRVRSVAFDHEDGRHVAVVFDQGIANPRLHELVDLYVKQPDGRVSFSSITFGKVREFYPLQAADIIATQSYWLAQEALGFGAADKDRDVAFRRIYAKMPSEGLLLNREGIIGELKRRGPDGRLLPPVLDRSVERLR
jgi:hypothetical protein